MTDRIRGFVVTLEKDMRDDDAEAVRAAISLIRYVGSVKNGPVVDMAAHLAKEQARMDMAKRIGGLLWGEGE